MSNIYARDITDAAGLRSFLGAGGSGDIVILTKDVELTETIKIKSGNIVLDLEGKSIYNKWGSWNISGSNRKKIDIFDVEGGTLTIQGSGSVYNQGTDNNSAIWVNGGTLNIKGNIKSEDYAAISIDKGSLNIHSGEISSNSSKEALEVNGGLVNINGGTIKNVRSINASVAVRVKGGNFYMNKGTIYAQSGTISAHALEIEGGIITLKGGTFTANCITGEKAINSKYSFNTIIAVGYGFYKDGIIQSSSNTSVSGTVLVQPINYSIIYSGLENASIQGVCPSSYTVESSDITISASATKDYYDFQGWRLDNTVSKSITIPKGSTGDKTLVAVWKGKEYKINYNLNKGTNSSENKSTYTYSTENVTPIYDPTRPYYTFENWYKDQTFTSLFGKEIPKGQSGDLNLYAKWTADTYAVKFYDGDVELTEYALSRSEEKGISAEEMPKPNKDGYVFLHWKSGDKVVTSVEKGHEPLSLEAEWKEVSYIVKYVSKGGTALEDESYTKTTVADHTWKTEQHIKKDGYVFKGWFLKDDYTGTPLTAFPLDANRGTVSEDKSIVTYTFYAKWELKNYSIVFENCEGVENKNYNIEEGVPKEKMPVPNLRNGYTFEGWCKGADKIDFIEKGIGDLTLTARWTPIEYTIKYNPNDGTVAEEEVKYTIEQTVKLPIPVKEHYVFAGWYTDMQLQNRFEGDQLVQEYGNKVFYAKWSPKVYVVKLETNGGSDLSDISYEYGSELKIKKSYKTGYSLAWYYDAALTKSFGDEKITAEKIPAGTGNELTLYAKWTPTEYIITYDTYYGKITSGKVEKYTIEQDVKLPTDMHREGFTFAGWYADDLLKEKATKIEKGSSGNKTFYATWDRGYQLIFIQPSYGKITVTRNGTTLPAGTMIGKGESLTVTVEATDANCELKELVIDGKAYTSSPQLVVMPEKDLKITATFTEASMPAASAPEIILTPSGVDKFPKGENVKAQLRKTDEATALYYVLDGAPEKAYSGEFLIESPKDTILLKAIARKEGYRDGIASRYIVFDNGKITLTFDLPLGVKATNPTGGDVVSATVAGGSFEFKLTVDQSYYTNLDSMVVAANDSTIKAGASGIYTLTNCPSDVTVTVSGLKAKTSTVTLQQTENGKISFTDGAEETTTTVDYGATVSITAVADEDFKFLQWNTGSQSNPLKLTVTKDTTISARFISDYKAYAITLPQLEGVTVKPFSGFTTEVKKDGTFKFYLQFANGYHEDNLVVRANGEELTKNKGGYAIYHINKNISISVEGIGRDAMTLKVPEHVTAKVVETMADVTKQGVYGETVVLLHAEAPAGKVFTKWTDGKTDNPRLSTALDAAQLIPLFDDKGDESYAKVILNQTAGAGITGVNANLDAVKSGDVIQLKVVLLPAYSQSEVVLTADDQKLSPEVSLRAATDTKTYVYKLPVQKDGLAVKVSGLKLNTYDVTMAQTDGGTVSVLPIGKVTHGDKIQLKAQPASGMLFVKWWDGNTLNPYPYTATSDTEVKAYFLGAESTVDNESIQKEEKAQITVSGQTLSVTVAEESMLYIWDYKGSLFRNQKIPAGAYTLNLPAGGYLVKVGDMGTRKIIIR